VTILATCRPESVSQILNALLAASPLGPFERDFFGGGAMHPFRMAEFPACRARGQTGRGAGRHEAAPVYQGLA
jgi:hypothetical protein